MADRHPSRRLSVAAQLLLLQLAIMIGVLATVLWLLVGQSLRDFETQEGRRTLSAAESLAVTPLVMAMLHDPSPATQNAALTAVESVRAVGSLTEAAVIGQDGVITAASDPALMSEPAPDAYVNGDIARSWTGTVEDDGRTLLLSRVPIYDETGELVGAAVAARAYPGLAERVGAVLPDLAVTILAFGAIGIGGSYLLSRRLKRQTLGMEPSEIARLVEHREALLHGVKEGVIAVDGDLRITVLNDAARELLGWGDVETGRRLDGGWVDADVMRMLRPDKGSTDDDESDVDVPLVVDDRLLVANRRPIRARGVRIGTVTTLRDRTELIALRSELNTSRTTTDLLRAQTHEFTNQLHTVSGLIQAEARDEALRFIWGISENRHALIDAVTQRIQDPPLTALLIAKASAAAERHVDLRIDEEAELHSVEIDLSHALVTVVGNLIDNAVDAVAGAPVAEIDVDISDDGTTIQVTVQDSGAGLGDHDTERLFERGFSTKRDHAVGGRGYGLALVRQICRTHGGDASAVDSGEGAVFTAVLHRRSDDGPTRTSEAGEDR